MVQIHMEENLPAHDGRPDILSAPVFPHGYIRSLCRSIFPAPLPRNTDLSEASSPLSRIVSDAHVRSPRSAEMPMPPQRIPPVSQSLQMPGKSPQILPFHYALPLSASLQDFPADLPDNRRQ